MYNLNVKLIGLIYIYIYIYIYYCDLCDESIIIF